MKKILIVFFYLLSWSVFANKVNIEPLHGIRYEKSRLFALVKSYGCTSVADFSVSLEINLILIERVKPDFCRGTPKLIEIQFSLPKSELNTYYLVNPIFIKVEMAREKSIDD